MKKSKWIAIIVCIALAMSSIASFAASVNDYKKKLDNVKKDKSKAQQELKQNKQEQKNVVDKIADLEEEIRQKEKEINDLFSKITQTKGDIDVKRQEIEKLKVLIEKQKKLLEKRLRVMYKTSNVEYMEILLSSNDISELMTNLEMIKNIVAYDKELIENLKNDREKVEKAKEDLEDKERQLVAFQQKAEAKKTQLAVSKGQQEVYKKELVEDAKEIEAQIDKFNKYAGQLQSEIAKLQSKGTTYGGGIMAWPAPGNSRITSPYGNRYHPILKRNKFHSGIDIAAATGSPIVAANDGTVIFSGWNRGYGNLVYVDHGGGIVTVYAHNSKLLVSKGDKVKRGQTIAKAGSTGMSTGPHLHFEVRKNGSTTNPISWVK